MVLSRRAAALLLVAGAFSWLVWPNFLRVVWKDDRAFGADGGPTAFLLVHVAIVVPALVLATALLWLGVRAWRAAPRALPERAITDRQPTDHQPTDRVPAGRVD